MKRHRNETSTEVGNRVVMYIRVSDPKQAQQGMSIENQRARLSEHCARKGWTIVGEHLDDGATGKTIDRRALKSLLASARKDPKPFDIVLAYRVNRIGRQLADFTRLRSDLAQLSISLRTTDVDTGDRKSERMLTNILAALAESENQERSETVQDNMETNARNGYWMGGQAPFGYQTQPVFVDTDHGSVERKVLTINAREAEVVRDMFRWRAVGRDHRGPLGIKRIVTTLNAEGRLNRRGKPWSIDAVHRILRTSTYSGNFQYRIHEINPDLKRNCDVREIINIPCQAIVDDQIFEHVQQLLEGHDPQMAAGDRNHKLMLTNLLHCSRCGAGMLITTGKGGRYKYYCCSNRHRKSTQACNAPKIPLGIAEGQVTSELLSILSSPENIVQLASALARASERLREPLKADEKSKLAVKNEIEKRIARLDELLLDGDSQRRARLEGKLIQEEAALKRATEELATLRKRTTAPGMRIPPAAYPALIRLLEEALQQGPQSFRRAAAKLLISDIRADGNLLDVSFGPFHKNRRFSAVA